MDTFFHLHTTRRALVVFLVVVLVLTGFSTHYTANTSQPPLRNDGDERGREARGRNRIEDCLPSQGGHNERDLDDGNRHRRGRPECEPGASGGVARSDFNGDGFADLAVGYPSRMRTTSAALGRSTSSTDQRTA